MKWKIAATVTGATVTAAMLPTLLQKKKKLHLDVTPPSLYLGNVNIHPIMKTCFGLLPESVRHSILLKAAAPSAQSIPRDRYDISKDNPYAVNEVIEGRVWKVTYERENHFMTNKEGKMQTKLLMDMMREDSAMNVIDGAKGFGQDFLEAAEKDIAQARYLDQKLKIEDEDVMKVAKATENMIVVKLNNGSIMLYAPVKIHDDTEFGHFLEQLGNIGWIVAPSSEHTLQLPAINQKFPDAKIIGSTTAEKKLNYVNALPRKEFDFNYTSDNDLKEANEILKKEGVELFYIKGDVFTHSLFAIAHNVALECDLLYGHHDGEGFLMLDKERFRKLAPEDFSWRLFKFGLLSKPNSPNGFLPHYRFWFMDPTCMWPFQLTPPNDDGSSCDEMADSLRAALNQEFDQAVGVHFNVMDGNDFRKSIDADWNWLDGKTLLKK